MTPERVLKKKIKEHLKSIGAVYFMPVTGGWGTPALDIVACIKGYYVEIETKTEGKKPTPRQAKRIDDIQSAGGIAFWCDTFEYYLNCLAAAGLCDD